MPRREALIFRDSDTLVAALATRLVDTRVAAAPVEYVRLERGGLAVSQSALDDNDVDRICKLGAKLGSIEGEWQRADCWPALILPRGGIEPQRPRSCLFVLADEASTLDLIAELLRLGCDRASFATLDPRLDSAMRVVVRAFEPPFYSVIRGAGARAPFVAYVPVAESRDDVWIEVGFAHELAAGVHAESGHTVLVAGDGRWRSFEAREWNDVLELTDVTVTGQVRSLAGLGLAGKLDVALRLRDASRNQSATLWVLDGDADDQVEKLVSSLPDDVVGRLLFAVGQADDGERRVVLRARPGRGVPPQIDVRGTAFVSHAGIANLFVPLGVAIEPPLRRDTLREQLAPNPAEVVWLVSESTDGGAFGIERISEESFAPLADWVEYTVAGADDVLSAWVAGVAFETSAFRSIGTEWAAQEVGAASDKPNKPSPSRASRPSKERRRSSGDSVQSSKPITVETPSLAALPEIVKGDRTTEETLAEIEREFLDDDAPVDSPARAEKWQLMARLHSELGNYRDASLCLLRWLWEAPEDEVAALASAWFLVSGEDTPLEDIVEMAAPSLEHVRAAVAQATGLVAAGVELPVEPAVLQQFFESNDAGLDVRSIWLGRLALSNAVGGDRLALARTRDRLLRQMSGGLALDRDVPAFLRFLGGDRVGGDSATVNELVRHLEALWQFVSEAKRERRPVEASEELTAAYVGFEFAYAIARLGRSDTAREFRDKSVAALSTPSSTDDRVHQFLVRAYCARIDQAIDGASPTTPLPATIAAALNELPKFERYKVDRLRQASTVLEPQERLDPVAAFQRGESDPRGEEFAELRGMEDVAQLHAEITRLLAVANDSATSSQDKARLFDGLMDFFPLLREGDATAALRVVVASIDDVQPKRRALLLEEALMLAGFFGREQIARDVATRLDSLLGELPAKDVIELAVEFGACLRSLRRVGLANRAASLLERLSRAVVGDGTDVVLARLQLAAGRAYLGDFESVESTLAEAQTLIESGGLVAADRLRVIRGLARAWSFAPTEQASAGLRTLSEQLVSISDSYNTNSHFCLSVVAFVDAIVLGFAGGELALGDLGRRWLDEDEYLVRRRIHRDLEMTRER